MHNYVQYVLKIMYNNFIHGSEWQRIITACETTVLYAVIIIPCGLPIGN